MNGASKHRCAIAALCLLTLSLIFSRPARADGKKEILIGTNLPLTGMLAHSGVEQRWSYEQAVKDVNAKGGIFVKEYGKQLPVKLVIEDDESNAGKATQAVERLIKVHKVDLLLSGNTAPFGVIPGCTAAEKYKKYYHASICTIPPWQEKHFKWSTLYFFDLGQAMSVPFELWNTLPKEKRPKKPALLMEDSFDGRAFGNALKEIGKKMGYTFALDQPLAVGAKDYSAEILKSKSLGVDAILIFTAPADTITFVRQMKENHFSVAYMHGWKGTWDNEFWQSLGKDAQYILADGFWSMDYPYPGAKELGEKYLKQYGKTSVSIGATYALAQSLFQAIEKAGTLDSAKVKQAVLSNTFETVMGTVKYGPDGVATFPSTANQWRNGRLELVYPTKLAKTKLELAPPWEKRK